MSLPSDIETIDGFDYIIISHPNRSDLDYEAGTYIDDGWEKSERPCFQDGEWAQELCRPHPEELKDEQQT